MERTDVFQWKHTISVPREQFIKNVVERSDLDIISMRVCLLLLTELDGWNLDRRLKRPNTDDPFNFKSIDAKQIADTLKIKKKEVKEAVKYLESLGIIEKGESRSSSKGWRFTF